MSAGKRIIHGNIASWCQIGVMLVSQLVMVPVFLSRWTTERYGIWCGLLALISMIAIPDAGFQEFLQSEFLKAGKNRPARCRRLLWSSIPIGIGLGFTEIVVVAIGVAFGLESRLLGSPAGANLPENRAIIIILAANLLVTWCFGSVTGIAVRALASLGYYPRISWWSVLNSFVTSALPALVVVEGGGLLAAGLAQALAVLVCGSLQATDMYRLLVRMSMGPIKPRLKLGLQAFVRSQAILYRSVVERFRQTGIRLALAPALGAVAVADFTTMRTGANVMQQGIGTLTGPVLPELMHFARQRDQDRLTTALSTIWIVVVGLLTPATIILQLVAPPLFKAWTRDKIDFEPVTFGAMSLTVLVSAVSQPAVALVKGNNLLKPQVMLATGSLVGVALSAVAATFAGLPGCAEMLLITEVALAGGYVLLASKWSGENGLMWPRLLCAQSAVSVVIASLGVIIIAAWPSWRHLAAILSIIMDLAILFSFWRSLPPLARNRTRNLVLRGRVGA